jgi:hypothetical protein
VSERRLDTPALAARCAARDLATSGIEMILTREDGRGSGGTAGAQELADGRALAALMREAAEAMYPDAATRDIAAVARVSEVVAAHEFGVLT